MTYGLIADNIDTSSVGMSMLSVVPHTSGSQTQTFSRNPYSSVVTWLVMQQTDIDAATIISFPSVSYSSDANNFYVTISGGSTPCYVYLFVR